MSGTPLFTLVIFMRQHFITLLMFVLNFVNLFTLVIFMKVDNISFVDACVEFCFLKK